MALFPPAHHASPRRGCTSPGTAAPPGLGNEAENAPTPFPLPTSTGKPTNLSPTRANPSKKIAGCARKIAGAIVKIASVHKKIAGMETKMEIGRAK
jgi:hypothetical protein